MVPSETILAMAARIVERFHPEKVILFGSHARGQAADASDVDLLVVLSQMPPRGKRSAPIIRMLATEFRLPVDVVVRTAEGMARWRDVPGSLPHEVQREGIVLYEKGG